MFLFALRRLARANYPDVLMAVYVSDEQYPAGARHPNRDKALL